MSQESEQAQKAWGLHLAKQFILTDEYDVVNLPGKAIEDYKAALEAEIESKMSDFPEEMNESEAIGYATLKSVLSLIDTVKPLA